MTTGFTNRLDELLLHVQFPVLSDPPSLLLFNSSIHLSRQVSVGQYYSNA